MALLKNTRWLSFLRHAGGQVKRVRQPGETVGSASIHLCCTWGSSAKTLSSGPFSLPWSMIHLLINCFIRLFIASSINPIHQIFHHNVFYDEICKP